MWVGVAQLGVAASCKPENYGRHRETIDRLARAVQHLVEFSPSHTNTYLQRIYTHQSLGSRLFYWLVRWCLAPADAPRGMGPLVWDKHLVLVDRRRRLWCASRRRRLTTTVGASLGNKTPLGPRSILTSSSKIIIVVVVAVVRKLPESSLLLAPTLRARELESCCDETNKCNHCLKQLDRDARPNLWLHAQTDRQSGTRRADEACQPGSGKSGQLGRWGPHS